ncbi:MAG TPA: serine hydroxymethyltransferase [Planctomycetota bacterium]|nr:serine hydroxymethyltransferase [Planctomycetota bacterium]
MTPAAAPRAAPPPTLSETDSEIAAAIAAEAERQERDLELIASENYCSRAVREAVGSVLTNKYAEGYPGRRYYGGCEHVDTVETLCRDRAKALFAAEAANVQPHSGSQANMAVLMALLQPGDSYLSMDLAHGGHLTHGHPLSFSGQLYRPIPYGVTKDAERIDMDAVALLAREHKPKLVLVGASAYPRHFDFARFAAIAKEVGALLMVDMAHIAGLVAAGVHPSPVPHADVVTLTTHKSLRGPRGGMILAKKDHLKAINSKVFPGIQGGPLMHVIAGKAVALHEAAQPSFKEYQQRVVASAAAMARRLAERGLRIVSGGTDNHLMLLDVGAAGLSGKQAEDALGAARITVNKNMIPYDTRPPMEASGIRLGTPAVCTRGFGPAECTRVADLIADVLAAPQDEAVRARARRSVDELAAAFPLAAIA